MFRFLIPFLGLALLAAACGGDDDGSAAAEVAEQPTPGEAVAATDEPQEAGAELTFEVRVLKGELLPGAPDPDMEIMVAIPAGWQPPSPDFLHIFSPPEDAGFDRLVTAMTVGASCGGGCGPQSGAEWAQRTESFEFAQFRDPGAFDLLREEELSDGRLVLAVNNFGNVALFVARWADGEARYLYCRFTGTEETLELVPQFEAACREATATFLQP